MDSQTSTIKIDKDVPMPNGGRRAKYPLGDLKVGDSFFVPGCKPIGGALSLHRPKKFLTRTRIEDGVTGLRVWRIA